MQTNLFIFIVALFLVIKGATMATQYAARLAESYRLSKYTVGFIVVAVISILPETFISINAALEGIPSFGLGVLFGSNIADLTLIFSIIILLTGRSLKIESKILKNHKAYPFFLLLPLILGLDGRYTRLEGIALIIIGGVFYYIALRNGVDPNIPDIKPSERLKNLALLLFSMAVLLTGSHFTVVSATGLAQNIGVNPLLIAILIVGLGTTIPELFFSLHSAKKSDDSLAVGDVLGTVLADATIVIGILATVSPFTFPQRIIYISGAYMVFASFMLFRFMRSGKTLSKHEGSLLFFIWLTFVLLEFIVNA